jgi:hypothetical protein
MDCSGAWNNLLALIFLAIGLLAAAIAVAYFWPSAYPLFGAAALVAIVSFGLIPAIKNALNAYASCRGASDKCTISSGVNTLGQAAAVISFVAFLVAGALQIAAIAALLIWIVGAAIAAAIEAAVVPLVYSGMATCAIVILLLLGVLTNAYGYKSCMDQQGTGSGGPGF